MCWLPDWPSGVRGAHSCSPITFQQFASAPRGDHRAHPCVCTCSQGRAQGSVPKYHSSSTAGDAGTELSVLTPSDPAPGGGGGGGGQAERGCLCAGSFLTAQSSVPLGPSLTLPLHPFPGLLLGDAQPPHFPFRWQEAATGPSKGGALRRPPGLQGRLLLCFAHWDPASVPDRPRPSPGPSGQMALLGVCCAALSLHFEPQHPPPPPHPPVCAGVRCLALCSPACSAAPAPRVLAPGRAGPWP